MRTEKIKAVLAKPKASNYKSQVIALTEEFELPDDIKAEIAYREERLERNPNEAHRAEVDLLKAYLKIKK